jgi:peptide/nickel transport system substrate-binding protein
VGTGPFIFKEWERGKKIVFSANADYWMKGYPKADGLVFHFIAQNKQLDAIISKKVDLLTDLPGTQTFMIAAGEDTKIIKRPELYTYVVSLDISTGPLADKNFRMAMNYAVDKTQLIQYDALGNGKPLGALAMPGEIGYSSDIEPYPFDLNKARDLIKKSRYNNTSFKVFVKVQAERTAKIVASQLKKIGITLDLHVIPDGMMQAALKDQKWDMVFGNCPDPMVHSFFVQAIILSSLSPFSVMRDAKYDEMLGELISSLTAEEQQRKGEILQRYIHENALGIFTYQRIRTYAMRRGLQFTPSITGMSYFYSTGDKHEKNKKASSLQK